MYTYIHDYIWTYMNLYKYNKPCVTSPTSSFCVESSWLDDEVAVELLASGSNGVPVAGEEVVGGA